MRVLVILALGGALGSFGCGSSDGGTGGSAGMGGSGGMGASAAAIAFCQEYDNVCTFGGQDRHADEAACLTAYDDSGQAACYETHLGYAVDMNAAATHCPHATGIGLCN
jgi:hypothetical protein